MMDSFLLTSLDGAFGVLLADPSPADPASEARRA
jgi:hypothetical protein